MADKYDDYTREELIRLLRERDRQPRFGLVWERDRIEHERALNEDFVALELDREASCGSAPYRNLLIEGDNFDALRYLRMTHAGRVKCIYIDPPYNTGNRDFIYNDRFVDKDDAWKHSKWLEFIYRRLLLARDLLSEDGVIFVSIGEDEFANLSLLMDQVFPGMKVGTFVWKRRSPSAMKKDPVSIDHEYVLLYANEQGRQSLKGTIGSPEDYPYEDERGRYTSTDLTVGMNKDQRPGQFYPIVNPRSGIAYQSNPNRVWRFFPETMSEVIKKELIIWPDETDGKMERPRYKTYYDPEKLKPRPVSTWIVPTAERIEDEPDSPQFLQSGMTSEGTRLLQNVLSDNAFPYPKPLSLLQSLIQQSTQLDGGHIILDFFAGSGTTGHAVLSLNAEDGGDRRFILVSSTEATTAEPEKNVCRDIARPRLQAAVNGYSYKTKNGLKEVEGLGGDFAYASLKRIPSVEVVSKIDHEQVWLALQLIHCESVSPCVAAPVQSAETETGVVIYAAELDEETIARIETLAANSGDVLIYSWQPGLLRQRLALPQASFEPIPQSLLQRFGGAA